jgi:hypothetical protein
MPGDDVHGDVARGGVVLQPVQHGPARRSRQVDVQRDGVGPVLARQLEPGLAVQRDDPLEPLLARHVEQDAGEADVVLDDEHHAVAGLDGAAVVVDRRLGGSPRPRGAGSASRAVRRAGSRRAARSAGRAASGAPAGRPAAAGPGHVAGRQEEREGAALALSCSPPGSRRPAGARSRGDGEAQAVPPYFRLVVPSACWNASKISRCLSFGMPMPVSLTAKAITSLRLVQRRVAEAAARSASRIVSLTSPRR